MKPVYANIFEGVVWQQLVENQIPQFAGYLLQILLALVIFWIGSKVIQKSIRAFRKYLLKFPLAVGMVTFGCSVLKFTLYAALVLILALRLGVKQTSVAALLGTAGVTVGLALQGGLSNVAGGVIILMFKPFQVGDYIVCSAGGFEGQVLKIELFYTTLETKGFQHTVVPNSILTSNPLVNETVQGRRQISIRVAVSYDTDLEHAMEVLRRVFREDPEAGKDPEPIIFADSFEDSGILLEARAKVKFEQAAFTKWRLTQRIHEVFEEENIQIPYPQVDVHMDAAK